MSYIRAIRKRAWDENAPYSADGYTIMNVQDLYDPNSDEGWQTSNKGYEYRFIYNEELEKLAIQRAYEYTLTNGDSQRPDGSSISTLKSENIGYDAVYELWAYDEIELTPKKSFDIWLNSKDEFGRTLFTYPMKEGPYAAVPRTPALHHTMGGLKIDEGAHVLDKDGNPIPGLFAAGEVTGGIHGANRVGGNAVVDLVVFGRIAGQNASAEAK